MMLETRQPVRNTEDFQEAWLKTRKRFGSLVEAETLKTLASQGFQEFGRGVVCLAFRHGQPCSFYLPSDRLSSLVNKPDDQWPLLSRLKTYQPEKSEIIVLVTFSDLEIEHLSPYQYFYLSVG
jgi:hypothetical protein